MEAATIDQPATIDRLTATIARQIARQQIVRAMKDFSVASTPGTAAVPEVA